MSTLDTCVTGLAAYKPSRKRAKTEDEKEQRRVERVLRNRRAAQSSRERKRLEVEALEKKNKELEAALNHARQTNLLLAEELKKFRRDSGARSSSPFDSFHSSNPVTLSQELFGSHDGLRANAEAKPSLVDELINSTQQSNVTVNPASLSPVPETSENEIREASVATPAPVDISSDMTQRPAAMLCDLQCQSEKMPQSWLATQTPQSQAWTLALHLQMLMITSTAVISACQRPLMQIAMSLRAGFSLPPTQSIMRTIIWLVTRPSSRSTRSTSRSSSTMSSTTLSPQTRSRRTTLRTRSSATASLTLRLKSLQKILTCSPNLARPLMDATMEALRLASEGCETRVGDSEAGSAVTRDAHRDTQTWLAGNPLPSKEVLLTLLWALRVEERKLIRLGKLPSPPTESNTHSPASITYILTTKAPLTKRKAADTMADDGEKRLRSC